MIMCLGVNRHLVSGHEISRLQHGLEFIMARYTRIINCRPCCNLCLCPVVCSDCDHGHVDTLTSHLSDWQLAPCQLFGHIVVHSTCTSCSVLHGRVKPRLHDATCWQPVGQQVVSCKRAFRAHHVNTLSSSVTIACYFCHMASWKWSKTGHFYLASSNVQRK